VPGHVQAPDGTRQRRADTGTSGRHLVWREWWRIARSGAGATQRQVPKWMPTRTETEGADAKRMPTCSSSWPAGTAGAPAAAASMPMRLSAFRLRCRWCCDPLQDLPARAGLASVRRGLAALTAPHRDVSRASRRGGGEGDATPTAIWVSRLARLLETIALCSTIAESAWLVRGHAGA